MLPAPRAAWPPQHPAAPFLRPLPDAPCIMAHAPLALLRPLPAGLKPLPAAISPDEASLDMVRAQAEEHVGLLSRGAHGKRKRSKGARKREQRKRRMLARRHAEAAGDGLVEAQRAAEEQVEETRQTEALGQGEVRLVEAPEVPAARMREAEARKARRARVRQEAKRRRRARKRQRQAGVELRAPALDGGVRERAVDRVDAEATQVSDALGLARRAAEVVAARGDDHLPQVLPHGQRQRSPSSGALQLEGDDAAPSGPGFGQLVAGDGALPSHGSRVGPGGPGVGQAAAQDGLLPSDRGRVGPSEPGTGQAAAGGGALPLNRGRVGPSGPGVGQAAAGGRALQDGILPAAAGPGDLAWVGTEGQRDMGGEPSSLQQQQPLVDGCACSAPSRHQPSGPWAPQAAGAGGPVDTGNGDVRAKTGEGGKDEEGEIGCGGEGMAAPENSAAGTDLSRDILEWDVEDEGGEGMPMLPQDEGGQDEQDEEDTDEDSDRESEDTLRSELCSDNGEFAQCACCKDGYHISFLGLSSLSSLPDGDWLCEGCKQEQARAREKKQRVKARREAEAAARAEREKEAKQRRLEREREWETAEMEEVIRRAQQEMMKRVAPEQEEEEDEDEGGQFYKAWASRKRQRQRLDTGGGDDRGGTLGSGLGGEQLLARFGSGAPSLPTSLPGARRPPAPAAASTPDARGDVLWGTVRSGLQAPPHSQPPAGALRQEQARAAAGVPKPGVGHAAMCSGGLQTIGSLLAGARAGPPTAVARAGGRGWAGVEAGSQQQQQREQPGGRSVWTTPRLPDLSGLRRAASGAPAAGEAATAAGAAAMQAQRASMPEPRLLAALAMADQAPTCRPQLLEGRRG